MGGGFKSLICRSAEESILFTKGLEKIFWYFRPRKKVINIEDLEKACTICLYDDFSHTYVGSL